ncbi:MAG: ABC transporter substrate-binding protein [Acidimicrobiia bacterium]|nr:ABC transporter substrate-binding protein [Acidimicrobiia bacterium]
MKPTTTRPESRAGHRSALWKLLALLFTFALVAAACGGDDDDEGSGETESEATAEEGAESASEESTEEDSEAPAEGGAELAADLPAVLEGAALPGGTYGGTVRISHGFSPTSLDPHTGSSGGDHHVLYTMYDRLTHFEFDTLNPTPGLATDWEFVDDTTLVFNLREGVTFHDGSPFNAEVVKFNIERGQNHPVTTVANNLASIDSVEVIDDLTVQLNLNRPDTGLIGILSDRAGMMVSMEAALAAEEERLDTTPVGTGAFQLVSYAPGDNLVLERNPDYWQEGLPYLDGIEWVFIEDEEAAINGVLAGELDMMSFLGDTSKVAPLEGDDRIEFLTGPAQGMDGCYMNKLDSPFADVNVRRAWAQSIDKEGLNEVLHFGFAEPAYLIVPPEHWAYDASLVPHNQYDIEGAKQLLADAGFADGVDIKMVMWLNPHEERKAEVIQASVADAGFRVDASILEGSAANAGFFENGEFDVYCSGWSGRPDPSQTTTALLGSESFYNYADVGVEGLDELVAAGTASADQTERAAAYSEAFRVGLVENLAWVPLWHHTNVEPQAPTVKGHQLNLYGKIQMQFVWLEG